MPLVHVVYSSAIHVRVVASPQHQAQQPTLAHTSFGALCAAASAAYAIERDGLQLHAHSPPTTSHTNPTQYTLATR